jgi:hypothetical protein
MKKTVTIRDITPAQWHEFQMENCARCPDSCPLKMFECCGNGLAEHKDMFSDAFLGKTVEVGR